MASAQILNRVFRGDVSLLVMSGMAAQVINLAAYPFLMQSYSPASFGAFSAISALAMFAGAAILLRFDTIIQIVNADEEEDVLAAAVVVGLGLSLAGMALMLVFGEWLFIYVAEDQDWQAGYALVVPLLALMNGLFALSRQYFAKKTRYRRFSLANFLRTLGMVAGQLLFVFVLPGPAGLIAGFGAGLVLALVLAWPLSSTILNRLATAPVQALHTARATIHRHRAYIRVDVVNALIATSVLSLYPIIVLIGFGAEQAGIFAVASRLVFLPIAVLAASISTVYFQRLSLAVRQGDGALRLFGVTLAGATATAASISLIVLVAGDPFVRLFFPPEWQAVAHTMVLLLPTFAVRFIIGCIGSTPLAIRRPDVLLIWNVTQVLILVLTWTIVHGYGLAAFLLSSGFALALAGTLYAISLAGLVRDKR